MCHNDVLSSYVGTYYIAFSVMEEMFTLIFFSLTNLFNYYYVFLIEIKRCNLNIQALIFMLNNFE